MIARPLLALFLLAASAGLAGAADEAPPPDILGITPGMDADTVEQKIAAINLEMSRYTTAQIRRDRRLAWEGGPAYQAEIAVSGPQEEIFVRQSVPAAGGKAYLIARSMTFPVQPVPLAGDLEKSLARKYGPVLARISYPRRPGLVENKVLLWNYRAGLPVTREQEILDCAPSVPFLQQSDSLAQPFQPLHLMVGDFIAGCGVSVAAFIQYSLKSAGNVTREEVFRLTVLIQDHDGGYAAIAARNAAENEAGETQLSQPGAVVPKL